MAFRRPQVLLLSLLSGALAGSISLDILAPVDTGLSNIHLTVTTPHPNPLTITYSPCTDSDSVSAHHTVASSVHALKSSRLVWRLPEDSPEGGCLIAWDEASGDEVCRSEVVDLSLRRKRRRRDLESIKMNNASGIDASGPWFDGVAYLEGKNVSQVDVELAKGKRIGIIGGGMAGLMSSLILESHGFHNFEIIESSHRVGGRIRTIYLEGEPSDYQYQEMGPMRFPESIKYPSTNETLQIKDHQIVFQLVETINKLNGATPGDDLSVDFIPWIQSSLNAPSYNGGVRNADGSVPTVGEIAAMNTTTVLPPGLEQVDDSIREIFLSPERLALLSNNMYRAHKQFINEGWDSWSEYGFIRNLLGAELNITDLALDTLDGAGQASFWGALFESFYFSATTWRTIDKGLERLPLAFRPFLGDRVKFHQRIEKAEYLAESNKIKFSWRDNLTEKVFQEEEFDYAFVAVPFTQVRRWRLPKFSSVLSRAIDKLEYNSACKVSLQFSTRFWEHLEQPILGGCTSTDIHGIGTICYPSYQLNRTGPGVMLASYTSSDFAFRAGAMSEEDHVQYVLNAIAEIHGPIVEEQYTGKFDRQCWLLDENAAASWAAPGVGQHELYIPSYFETENNVIFIGEHTAYTHAWISSALESAVRGTVQLMLEMGLVDEAKNITSTWMSRWMVV
ncbi:uncharacterized protein H6S33_006207 [Morchella sextelata]|uniref:uncharacterized protein n=1 Tax=Morchella sextelata TaxID=1174677 RepID=UPI001D03B429|nr:uncharacterized protein H6S33_006207 [Morchella sextelata]KAH0614321.1 hypothetical protein H6S33_006207 [Morchella sextelata]